MLLHLSRVALLSLATAFAAVSANAANLSPNLNIRTTNINSTATLAPVRGLYDGAYVAPAPAYPPRPRGGITSLNSNDQFDTNGNINPGGGGGGSKPDKTPKPQ